MKTESTAPAATVAAGTGQQANLTGVLAVAIIVAIFLLFPQYSIHIIARFTRYSTDRFGLAIVLFSSLMVVLSLLVSLSPLGRLRLGGAEAKPEFGVFSWLAMLFTCGMGSGLIFWGVAEPVFHFANLPAFAAVQGGGADAALALTYFHWGVHAWSIYALAALAVGWFGFNRGRSLRISAAFTARQNHSAFRLMDWLAVLAIVFGVAGTFANAIALIQTGLEHTIAPDIGSVVFRYGTMLLIAILFTGSSVLGLHRGIKRLSQFNVVLMLALLAAVVLLVNPLNVLNRLFTSTISYLTVLPAVSFSIAQASRGWSLDWTVIYIVWWVAWTPFVAPFIARISHGRTVRQFLLSVIGIPTLASMVWFSAFGGMALEQSFADGAIQAVQNDYTQGLFYFFAQLSAGGVPLGQTLTLLAVLLLITFLITSADSALLICTMLAGNGGNREKTLWAALLVALSMALMYINDVDLNKQVAIAGAIPFALVMSAQVAVVLKDMAQAVRTTPEGKRKPKQ